MATTISPHSLSRLLKRVKKYILLEDFEEAINVLEEFIQREFDAVYFSAEVAEALRNKLWRAQLILILECPGEAMDLLGEVRDVLDGIFVRNLWLADRLLNGKECAASIGTLAELPEGIRFEIFKELVGSL